MSELEKETVNAEEVKIEDAAEAVEAEAEKTEEAAENAEETVESTEENAEASEDEKLEEAKKKLFGKKEKKPDPKDEKIAELSDKVMRQMAEFDNFRKRTEREKSMMFESGTRDVLEKILPIADNFERGFKGMSEEELATPFAQGMEKVYKQLQGVLDGLGVKEIESVGKEFDPNLHNAVLHEDNEEVGENIITEEYQKGYTYRDTVIRHSMVKVAN